MAAPAEAQRERAVGVLKRAYAEGRLELEELEARTARVLTARSPLELRLQLRGLLGDDVRRRARRGLHVLATVLMWLFLSFFLAVGAVVALIATHASAWTLLFPAVWILMTLAAGRELRRTR